MRRSNFIHMIVFCLFGGTTCFAQMDNLHGDFLEIRDGVHSGNLFRTTFYNDGTYGTCGDPSALMGEWPINSGHYYLIDGDLFVGSEILDTDMQGKHVFSTVRSLNYQYSIGDRSPDGDWWTFLPLPGFASRDTNKIAMTKWPWSWPDVWPDKMDDPVDPGWVGSWNGYFGKDIFNADEESYFVADDYNNAEFKFYPDSNDFARRGLGIRLWVRGFQWANTLVEDGLFSLFDLENIGTHNHDKMIFAYKYGNGMGHVKDEPDAEDDSGGFDRSLSSAYLYDHDNIGGGDWTPVGYFGGVFLESPGNPFDGIDNDGDGIGGSGIFIDESMFEPRILGPTDQIVVTDYITFERRVTTLHQEGVDTLRIKWQDLIFKFWAGKKLQEIPFDLVDNNLNGIIDENNGAVVGEGVSALRTFLSVGLKAVDYINDIGTNNRLLDERRDDGIDNDGDWSLKFDDVGADGVPYTGDQGEGDGQPTSGEPHFDKTDIDETDMIGLSSFTLYRWQDLPQWDDEKIWSFVLPGLFDQELLNNNTELLFASGYFPHKAGTIERFSMGTMCGMNLDDLLTNVKSFSKVYQENYNFAKAPNVPTFTAIPGNGKVTLVWDTYAEESQDPVAGFDFEGYKIYRSTDPGWNDAQPISDGQGATTFRKPLIQFDLDNDVAGYFPIGIKGIHFYLGDNTGIVNTWTDTTVVNGQTYFYAVTSFDRGSIEYNITPSECAKYITLNLAGDVEDKGPNVAVVRPEAPAAGFVNASLSDVIPIEGGHADGVIGYTIVNPMDIKDGHRYRITFEDTMITSTNSSGLTLVTQNMTVVNITNPGAPDTVIERDSNVHSGDVLPIVDGFQLKLTNIPELHMNTDSSLWSRDSLYGFTFIPYRCSRIVGRPKPHDYLFEFGLVGIDTSIELKISSSRTVPAIPVNFIVTNLISEKKIDFVFYERDALPGQEGQFTAFTDKSQTDEIILFEPEKTDSIGISWQLKLDSATNDSLHHNPRSGDQLFIKTRKPFLSADVYEFETRGQSIQKSMMTLDYIKVVPNPYVVSNSWEPINPYSNGRGPRELHFTHLPPQCTIKIFNIRGMLVRELEHDNSDNTLDGTLVWDMLTKDRLDIAYGIYIYHVDAGENGEKIGKFAVIK